uniref:Uncharacterized protein n=1 Tax=Arundo donax TaxID=35708 RepID=A0A0A8YQ56_ARUDO
MTKQFLTYHALWHGYRSRGEMLYNLLVMSPNVLI